MKKNKRKLCLILGAVYLALFVALAVGLVCSDFGDYTKNRFSSMPSAECDGFFCSLNEDLFRTFGVSQFWYNLSEILGFAAFLLPLAFAGLGLVQLCKGRSLKKVDKDLYLLAGLYVVTGIFYVLFEKIVINYRPILTEEGLEASFPSTHTLLVCVILGSASFFLQRRLRNRWLRRGINGVCFLWMVAVSVGRLLAGVHWFTDVLGGVLLGGALVFFFKAANSRRIDKT